MFLVAFQIYYRIVISIIEKEDRKRSERVIFVGHFARVWGPERRNSRGPHPLIVSWHFRRVILAEAPVCRVFGDVNAVFSPFLTASAKIFWFCAQKVL